MDLNAVTAEVGEALQTIDGLKVLPFTANHLTPPSALFGYPEDTAYDLTYQAGTDSFTLPITIVVAALTDKGSYADLMNYASGSGPRSVRAAVRDFSFTACDVAMVVSAEFGTWQISGTDYLAVTFDVRISGKGA